MIDPRSRASNRFNSAVVTVAPSNISSSASSTTALPIVNPPLVITPVVVIVEDPVSIVPNPDVIDPLFNAPVVTILLPPTLWLEKYVDTVSTLVIFIVPPSLTKRPSPVATASVPLAVPPSIRLISAAVDVTAVDPKVRDPSAIVTVESNLAAPSSTHRA